MKVTVSSPTVHAATIVLGCILLLSALGEAGARKVLVLSMQFGSHLNEFAAISHGLLEMGHTVHVVMDENLKNPTQFRGMDVQFLYYKSPNKSMVDQKLVDERWTEVFLIKRLTKAEAVNTLTQPRFTYDCKMALHDADLLKHLEEEKYDIALVDLLIPCYYLLTHKIGVPTVSLSTLQYTWFVKTHPLVNFFAPCGVDAETNTFLTRLTTFFLVIYFERYVLVRTFVDMQQFTEYGREKPYSSWQDIAMKSKLFIMNKNGVIDCPTPSMPNLIQVGGLTTKPPKPLPADYQKFVDDSQHGVIVLSFGSAVAYIPKEMFLKFLSAFGNIKQRVIWRITRTYDETIPENVKIVQWMPQNDLLAHPNVKLFITHCGGNGQFEAVNNGVPMLSFPVFAEQEYNAQRAFHKGYGLRMNIHNFTSEELIKAINEIIQNPKYSAAIKKASAIHRSLPDPRKTSAFWIDHVMEHGDDHLRTSLSEMTSVQYFMIDIFAFLALFVLLILFVLKKLVQFAIVKFAGHREDVAKKTN
ncbi:2-hydroxyacylsphingosine 1-beta-galactosyltransferase-like [Lineus longissimus]|uniref:2-hydroxyacylsphingosine 1-beta-galactosyltransferase-like n=1 Tax=Lineus longissimus TaxID=88925 RepID=UPI00315D02CB